MRYKSIKKGRDMKREANEKEYEIREIKRSKWKFIFFEEANTILSKKEPSWD
jgi:hypothetical protein